MERKVVVAAVIAVVLAVPQVATTQTRFVNPWAAAAEAAQRYALCQDIIRAGGSCPDDSVPLDQMRTYFTRLVDRNWEALRAQQQREIAASQLEQRFANALSTALGLQEQQFRKMFEGVQHNLDEVREQLGTNGAGWMMWVRTTVISEQDAKGKDVAKDVAPAPSPWQATQGFDRFVECRTWAADYVGGFVRAAEDAKKNTSALTSPTVAKAVNTGDVGALVEIAFPNGGKRLTELAAACFPATFDPRPQ